MVLHNTSDFGVVVGDLFGVISSAKQVKAIRRTYDASLDVVLAVDT